MSKLTPRGELLILVVLFSSLLLSACGALPDSSANIYSLTASNNPLVVEDVYPIRPLQGAAVSYRLGLNLGESGTIKQGQVLRVTLQGNNPGDIDWSAGNLPRLTFGPTALELQPVEQTNSESDTPVFKAFVPVAVELTAQPYPLEISFADATGTARQIKKLIRVEQVSFPYQDLNLDGDMAWLADHQADEYDDTQLAAAYQTFSPVQLWQDDWQLPINVPWNLTTAFGEQRTYNGQQDTLYYHEGADMGPLSSRDGDPVLAPAAGKVVFVGELQARGLTVAIDHGLGVTSYYFHLSQISIEPGQSVEPGDILGLVGSTGRATGPHLHWEVRVQGVPVIPFSFVARP